MPSHYHVLIIDPIRQMPNPNHTSIQVSTFKYCVLGGLLAFTAFFAYFFYKRTKLTIRKENDHKTEMKGRVDEPYTKQFARVMNGIKRYVKVGEKMSNMGAKQIYRGQYQLGKKEYKQLTLRSREGRRKWIENLKTYREMVETYEEDIEDVKMKHLDAILANLNIDKLHWIQKVDEMASQQRDGWDQFLLDCQSYWLQCLIQNHINLPSTSLIGIAKYKFNKLKEKRQEFSKMGDIEDSDKLALIENWVDDMVYLEYGVEAEDIQEAYRVSREEKIELEAMDAQFRQLLGLIVSPDLYYN